MTDPGPRSAMAILLIADKKGDEMGGNAREQQSADNNLLQNPHDMSTVDAWAFSGAGAFILDISLK